MSGPHVEEWLGEREFHSFGAYLWSTYYVPGIDIGILMQWQDRQGFDPHFGGGGVGGRDRP